MHPRPTEPRSIKHDTCIDRHMHRSMGARARDGKSAAQIARSREHELVGWKAEANEISDGSVACPLISVRGSDVRHWAGPKRSWQHAQASRSTIKDRSVNVRMMAEECLWKRASRKQQEQTLQRLRPFHLSSHSSCERINNALRLDASRSVAAAALLYRSFSSAALAFGAVGGFLGGGVGRFGAPPAPPAPTMSISSTLKTSVEFGPIFAPDPEGP